ncbi:hypothetical protein PMN64_37930 [Bradyrhizobium sp. UFLA01-814]|uniref:hypothetical protein n=1 Tax=Bradyrhizobium sp. UFLA01-814 TaxID=3023480 RepID=UPI00398AE81D
MQNLTPAFNFPACGEVAAAEHRATDVDRRRTFANDLLVLGARVAEYANYDIR